MKKINDLSREFPGSKVVRMLHSHYRGVWVQSLVGEIRSHMPWGTAKKKKKKLTVFLYTRNDQ